MFTRLVHWLLRAVAGGALLGAASAVALTEIFGAPLPACAAPRTTPTPPEQRLSATDDYEPVHATFDTVGVILPPKPKPRPVPVVRQAAPNTAGSAPESAPSGDYSTPSGTAQEYAAAKVGSGQFTCLLNLWNRESGWNTHAENADSGAYGIPQSLPGSKMAVAGGDWRNNFRTQVDWGLSYISSTYGSPCAAWAHSNAVGWY
jgi:hypothetical protein